MITYLQRERVRVRRNRFAEGRARQDVARPSPSVIPLIGLGMGTKSSLKYLELLSDSPDLLAKKTKLAGKAMSNGEPNLREQSG